MARPEVHIEKLPGNVFEVFINSVAGLAVSEDGENWKLSPNIRKFEKSVWKKIQEHKANSV